MAGRLVAPHPTVGRYKSIADNSKNDQSGCGLEQTVGSILGQKGFVFARAHLSKSRISKSLASNVSLVITFYDSSIDERLSNKTAT